MVINGCNNTFTTHENFYREKFKLKKKDHTHQNRIRGPSSLRMVCNAYLGKYMICILEQKQKLEKKKHTSVHIH